MLKPIASEIWVSEQSFRYFGLEVGTRMTVVRFAHQQLAIISPIQMNDAIVGQLNELGTVQHIIAPNLYHYLFAATCKTLYPNALLWAVPGLDAKKPDLPIDRIIQQDTDPLWDELKYIVLDGFKTLSLNGFDLLNECIFYHATSRTLILTDAAFHFDESFPVLTQFAARAIGSYKQLSPSLLERIATTDKAKVRRSVEQILHWDFDRVVMAHGKIVEQQGKQWFKEGYEQFLR